MTILFRYLGDLSKRCFTYRNRISFAINVSTIHWPIRAEKWFKSPGKIFTCALVLPPKCQIPISEVQASAGIESPHRLGESRKTTAPGQEDHEGHRVEGEWWRRSGSKRHGVPAQDQLNWWGPAVWIPRIPLWKGMVTYGILGVSDPKHQFFPWPGDSIRDLTSSPVVGGHVYHHLKGSRKFTIPKKVTNSQNCQALVGWT